MLLFLAALQSTIAFEPIVWNAEHMRWIGVMRACGATGDDLTLQSLIADSFRDCETSKAPCMFGAWGAWGACDRTCGSTSVQVRKRTMGHCTTPFVQSRACDLDVCTRDCVWHWGAWGDCSHSCGGGHATRTRNIIKQARGNGRVCPTSGPLRKSCNAASCPVDCVYSAWVPGPCKSCNKDWKACHIVKCGSVDGTQALARDIKMPPMYGGKACAHRSKFVSCGRTPCAVDCITSEWSLRGHCDAVCLNGTSRSPWGEGVSKRTRTVVQEPKHGGKPCGALVDQIKCRISCTGDCVVSRWSTWTACSRTCVSPTTATPPQYTERKRTVVHESIDKGKPCPKAMRERKLCGTAPCPFDCAYTEWTPWSRCSTTCGAGRAHASHQILAQAQHGGMACNSELTRWSTCNQDRPCRTTAPARPTTTPSRAVLCAPVLGEWGGWGPCSKSCGIGLRDRKRTQTVCTGNALQKFYRRDYEYCRIKLCPTPPDPHTIATCTAALWSSWSSCSGHPCGMEQRNRKVVNIDTCACRVGAHRDTAHLPRCPALTATRGCGASCNGAVEKEHTPIADAAILHNKVILGSGRGRSSEQKMIEKLTISVEYMVGLAALFVLVGLAAKTHDGAAAVSRPPRGEEGGALLAFEVGRGNNAGATVLPSEQLFAASLANPLPPG